MSFLQSQRGTPGGCGLATRPCVLHLGRPARRPALWPALGWPRPGRHGGAPRGVSCSGGLAGASTGQTTRRKGETARIQSRSGRGPGTPSRAPPPVGQSQPRPAGSGAENQGPFAAGGAVGRLEPQRAEPRRVRTHLAVDVEIWGFR